MAKIWILDENSEHVATISGDPINAHLLADNLYPNGLFGNYKIDVIGPHCANAQFDLNPDAKIIEI